MYIGFIYAWGKKPKDNPLEKFNSVPDTIKVGNNLLVLDTYLWRDFMPISPPDGKPLKAVIYILPVDAKKLPPHIDADKVWIIYKDKIWSDSLEHIGRKVPTETLNKLEKIASGGPKWGPGVTVTVVVQILDKEGRKFLLKANNQMIYRTD